MPAHYGKYVSYYRVSTRRKAALCQKRTFELTSELVAAVLSWTGAHSL